MSQNGRTLDRIQDIVESAMSSVPAFDVHTHLFDPRFGGLGLWGIDRLLTYHYLEAELFRCSNVGVEEYHALPLEAQADSIWRALFVERAPLSEAARGVIAVMRAFGLDTNAENLDEARAFFASRDPRTHITDVFRKAGVDQVVMTNDPLDPLEAPLWSEDAELDPRFHAALRLDRVLDRRGESAHGRTVAEVRRFLDDWCDRMQPVYMAVSLPDTFRFPEESGRARILEGAVLPACRERGIPLSLMIGVRRQVNPRLRLAGDGVGRADLSALEFLCREFPENRFLVSVLSRENQHELCVLARKFANLMPFGCWWFLNNPSIVEEMTRERLEMLGTSFIPQHSDARVLEQLIYKWRNTRRTLAPILAAQYRLLAEDGRRVTRGDIERDVARWLRSNATGWLRIAEPEAAHMVEESGRLV